MTHKQKAADRRHGRAASEISCIRNDNKLACKRPATFIPIDEQNALGADAHAWHILKRHRYKGNYRWEPIAWYPTLEQCINGFVESRCIGRIKADQDGVYIRQDGRGNNSPRCPTHGITQKAGYRSGA
jgi:hypothetical protein